MRGGPARWARPVRPFADRHQAGAELALRLQQYAGRPDVVVLALPRGGVPVAFDVAQALDVPLDVFVVRKLGLPGHRELAFGAIASGNVRVLNDDVIRRFEVPDDVVDGVTREEQTELERREREYRADRDPIGLRGKVVILVDDGLATGATMRAALQMTGELRDGVSGEILLRVIRIDNENFYMFNDIRQANRLTNAREIRLSMERWSRLVLEAIDVAKATKPPDPRAK